MWWDDKAIYLEQKFITTSDNFVRAIAMSKQCITKVDVIELMKKLPAGDNRPEISEELKVWLDSIEISSKKLRNKDE